MLGTNEMPAGEEKLRAELTKLAQSGPRKISAFAGWLLDHLDEVAFLSIRGLTKAAGVDANLAPRLAQSLGYGRYNDFRAEVQRIIQTRNNSYVKRARALSGRESSGIYNELIAASRKNFKSVTSPKNIAVIEGCVDIFLKARNVHSIGVRSCFSVAHYFSYVGAMAFENFIEVPSMPGGILDQMSQVEAEDVVFAITYEHYSAEVVRACQVAFERGAKVIVLTDADSSPTANSAEQTIILPMSGPQLMPSLVSAFLTVEMILAAMASKKAGVADRIEEFEQRIAEFGGYTNMVRDTL